jgi:hypothetical protein
MSKSWPLAALHVMHVVERDEHDACRKLGFSDTGRRFDKPLRR